MNSVPVGPVSAVGMDYTFQAGAASSSNGATPFSEMLMSGVNKVNQQLVDADALASAFALDDSIPVHQVTFAMEKAHLSVQTMLEIRTKLLDGYQQLMQMQL